MLRSESGLKLDDVWKSHHRVINVVPGIQMTLEAFEGYWRKVPRVKRLVLRSLPDETT